MLRLTIREADLEAPWNSFRRSIAVDVWNTWIRWKELKISVVENKNQNQPNRNAVRD